LLPVLYLRGVWMGDFQEALGALLGKEAPNLSPSVVARLRGEWEADYARWQGRDLSARQYVYVWADGIYLQARMEPQAECMLVRRWCTWRLEVEIAPNPRLLCDDRLAADGVWASGRQHPVQHRHADGSLGLLGGEAAGPQPGSDQRLVATHCRFH